MMDPRLPKHIIELVDTVCPYEKGTTQQLYHAGFLAAYLGSLFESDPYLFKDFQRHLKRTQLKQRRK